jgi:hypothetical protein
MPSPNRSLFYALFAMFAIFVTWAIALSNAQAADAAKILPTDAQACEESRGEAFTCVVQCDPGTRGGFARIFSPGAAPGVESCRVFGCVCAAIASVRTGYRPGFRVQDTGRGDLAFVTFGVDALLGPAELPSVPHEPGPGVPQATAP